MKKIPKTVIFIVIIFAGGIGITIGFEIIFEAFDIPYNENLSENRIKRISEPLDWIADSVSDSSP